MGNSKLLSSIFAAAVFLVGIFIAAGSNNATPKPGQESLTRHAPSIPTLPFSPSNARTVDGRLIEEAQWIPASRCSTCHQDTHSAWSDSLHHSAGREPFYKESVDLLKTQQGVEFTRHCESCHAPLTLLTGSLTRGQKSRADFIDEGVTCVVCHSITEARVDGTGSYTIRRPALLVKADGTPVYENISDKQILDDIESHKRAMMRPLLKQPEFCATCHKSMAPPELNGYKFIRGFASYDEWQQSSLSKESLLPYYKRPQRLDCRACHMPKTAATNDLAAKNGQLSSHRWLGANTAAPQFYGQKEQVALTEAFLKKDVLHVDIFSVKQTFDSKQIAPLSSQGSNKINLRPGDDITVEIVIANRNAGHSFPPELRDLYEAWVEFEAVDASGREIFHNGSLDTDGNLDDHAHVYHTVLLDDRAAHLNRHEVWLASIKAYDNTIPPGRSDVVRYRFQLPADGKQGSAITLRARVNYRRFNKDYSDFVLNKQKAQLNLLTVNMAEAKTEMVLSSESSAPSSAALDKASEAHRWNDYGIGLIDQAQYGAAAEAFRNASNLDQTNASYVVNCAMAEMKTERFGPEREQWQKAEALLERALQIEPNQPRARYFRALLLRGYGRSEAAADELTKLSQEFPRDREVQRQLGQTLYAIGKFREAKEAFERLLVIDPTDAGAYQFLSPLYALLGNSAKSAEFGHFYLLWRDDPLTDVIAGRFFASHPDWADERIGGHVHGQESSGRTAVVGYQNGTKH